MAVLGESNVAQGLSDRTVREIIFAAADAMGAEARRVLVIVPDHTRSCPLPLVVRTLHEALARRAKCLDFLIALGTHPPLDEGRIDRLLGLEPGRRGEVLPGSRVFNHDWKDPGALTKIGELTAGQLRRITGGASDGFERDIDVTINRRIFDYDVVLIAGPVFPHEVVGFSGGAKYFFPGICGEQLLNFFHWLGALITVPKMIGCKDTPVRATLEAAADMVSVETHLLAMVVHGGHLAGLYFGGRREAWSAAADLSDKVHITYVDRPFDSVLSRAPEMYDDLWVGAKCMYKLEPVIADGGELIIYAPHIREISVVHGALIEEIGYHTLEYFTKQWDRFKGYPWGVLAHSTHVRGIGGYDAGIERPRVKVTLATGISEETCRRVTLGYRDPESIDTADWQGRQDEGRLYVPKAGEMLYRLADPPPWARP